MAAQADRWVRDRAQPLLKRVGVRRGICLLDFGCWEGRYALPAARIVGDGGRVYAVDKDKAPLRVLKRAADREGLRNIEAIHVPPDGSIPMRAQVADLALLYDVLHAGYLPEKAQRESRLREIHRVLKPGGRLSCYLTHLKEFRLTFGELLGEIESAGFRLRGESRRTLLHSDNVVRGRVFSFEKRCGSRQVRRGRPEGKAR
jgi:ubiquinone/menaquinone biosynthesis C-methylase UbiE